MNDGLKKVFIFAAGAVAGSFVTFKLVKDKFAQIAQEEIDSVRDYYRKCADEALSILDDADKAQKDYEDGLTDQKPDLKSYGLKIIGVDLADNNEEEEDDDDSPYVIDPEQFDEYDDYDAVTLIYYTDGVLADEADNVIEDVDGIVGLDSLNHFGDYGEEDSVYVRNDFLKCDYEILMDTKKYSDIIKD